MVSNDSWPPLATYTTMTFDMAFDLRGKIQGLSTATGYLLEIVRTYAKMVQPIAVLPEQLTQP